MKRILSGAVGLALVVFSIGFVASAAKADTITRPVGDAGSVTFTTDGGVLALVGAEAAEGWTYTIDRQDGSHLTVTFRDGAGAEVEFEAEFEDGSLEFGGSEEPGSPTATEGDGATTTMDEDDSDDDAATTVDDDADEDSQDDADHDSDDDSDHDADDDSASGSPDAPVAPESASYVVGSAGTVSVLFADGEVSLTGVTTTDGWNYEVDHMGGSHVEIEFRGPDGAGFEFRVDADGSITID